MRLRLEEFSLALHPDKTRLLEFDRNAAANRQSRGLGRPETFAFLGFIFISGRSHRGAITQCRSPVPEWGTPGSVRGVPGNWYPYRDLVNDRGPAAHVVWLPLKDQRARSGKQPYASDSSDQSGVLAPCEYQ